MNFTAKVNGQLIFEWVTMNLPPLTWSIMAVKIGTNFLDSGVDPFNLDKNEVFDKPLLLAINNFLNDYYGVNLPDFYQ